MHLWLLTILLFPVILIPDPQSGNPSELRKYNRFTIGYINISAL